LAGFHEPPPTSAGTPEYADELRPRYSSMPQNAGPRIPCLASTNAWRTRAMRPLPSDGSVVYVDPDGNATAPD